MRIKHMEVFVHNGRYLWPMHGGFPWSILPSSPFAVPSAGIFRSSAIQHGPIAHLWLIGRPQVVHTTVPVWAKVAFKTSRTATELLFPGCDIDRRPV